MTFKDTGEVEREGKEKGREEDRERGKGGSQKSIPVLPVLPLPSAQQPS